MKRIKIRFALKKDIPEIVQLLNELGYSSDENQIKDRISQIRKRNEEVLVALDDQDEILGCVHTLIDVRLAEGKIGEIVSLVVKSSMRGQGIGSFLLEEAKKWLRQSECKTIRVRANAVRKEAHKFYENHGFEEMKTQKIFQINIDS